MGILEIGLTIWAWHRGWKSRSLLPISLGIMSCIFLVFVLHDVGEFDMYIGSISGFIIIELVVIAVLIYMIVRPRKGFKKVQNNSTQKSAHSYPGMEPTTNLKQDSSMAGATLVLPNGKKIDVEQAITPIGRKNFEDSLPSVSLNFISRRQCWIRSGNGQYYIEDYLSANGTKLNGVDIKGKGLHSLKDMDRIDIAGVVVVVFKILQRPEDL